MRMWAGCVHLEFGVPIWAPGISRNSCIIYVLEASPEYDELYPRCRNMHIPAALLEKRVRSRICLFWDVECRPLRARPRTPCAGAENGSELKGYSRLHFWGHEITADARDLAHPRGRPGLRIPTIRQSRQAALVGSGGVRNGVPKQGISPCPECATPPIYPLNSRVQGGTMRTPRPDVVSSLCHPGLANSKGKWGGWHIRDMVIFPVSAPHYAPPRIPQVLLGDFAGLWGSAALADPLDAPNHVHPLLFRAPKNAILNNLLIQSRFRLPHRGSGAAP